MNSKHLTGSFIALCLIFFVGCSEPVKKIVIISTNDIHGELDAFPRLATYVEGVRDTAQVLLLDAGDRWTGNPFTDLAQKPGFPIIELMNKLSYDFSTLGNHEFDNGQQILSDRIEDSEFHNLVATMKVVDSDLPELPPYALISVGDVKIALLGMVHNYENGHPDGKPQVFEGLEFSDPVASAQKYRSLKDSADLFVAITHIGVQPDSILAVAVPELDLIIGGHSHTVLPNGKKVGNTLITQTGKSLNYVGVTEITVRGDKVLSIENSLVKLDSIPANPQFQQMVDQYKHNPELIKAVGSVAQPMDKTEIANWLTDLIRKDTETDIAFYNMGGIRLDHFDKGDITVADVYSLEPFHSAMLTFDMTPQQIKTLILNKFNSNGKASQVIDLYPSGVSYKVVRDAEGAGTDVIFTPALKKSNYSVALSDYVSSAYIFDLQGKGEPFETKLTDMIIDNLEEHSPIKVKNDNRVEI